MNQLTLRIHRLWSDRFESFEARELFHRARGELIHEMAAEGHIDVLDWGDTDSEYPREVVEVVIAIGTHVIAGIIADYIRDWLKKDRVKEVEIMRPDGTSVGTQQMTQEELGALGDTLWTSRLH